LTIHVEAKGDTSFIDEGDRVPVIIIHRNAPDQLLITAAASDESIGICVTIDAQPIGRCSIGKIIFGHDILVELRAVHFDPRAQGETAGEIELGRITADDAVRCAMEIECATVFPETVGDRRGTDEGPVEAIVAFVFRVAV
jgi:hypothetical protein